MSRIALKTDYLDGQVLFGNDLNANNEVAMEGVNDNYDLITKLNVDKVDISIFEEELAKKADKSEIIIPDVTKSYVDNGLSKKVDKVDGKGLSTNDFTNELKTTLENNNSYLENTVKKELPEKADKSEIPIKISQLQNDSSFVDKTYVDTGINTAKNEAINSSNSYTDNKIAGLGNVQRLKGRVDTFDDLPSNPAVGDTYLVGLATDIDLAEYVWTEEDKWELLGSLNQVDLSNYYTKDEADNSFLDKETGETELAKKLENITVYSNGASPMSGKSISFSNRFFKGILHTSNLPDMPQIDLSDNFLQTLLIKSTYDTNDDGIVDKADIASNIEGYDVAQYNTYYGKDDEGVLGFYEMKKYISSALKEEVEGASITIVPNDNSITENMLTDEVKTKLNNKTNLSVLLNNVLKNNDVSMLNFSDYFTVTSEADKVTLGVDTSKIPTGPQGEPGKDGTDGVDGISPLITVNTSTDDTYILNITDASGTTTTPNLKGTSGKDGADGADGAQGPQGVPGKDGAQGPQGVPGTDGNSLEFQWQGTALGIRQEGQTDYQYVDLKGDPGSANATKFYIEESDPEEPNSSAYLTGTLWLNRTSGDLFELVEVDPVTGREWQVQANIFDGADYDSLPVGSILDYEGDTIPEGYEEVENPLNWKGNYVTTGEDVLNIPNDANELLILVSLDNNPNVIISIHIPCICLSTDNKGFNGGCYNGDEINCSVRIIATNTSLYLHTAHLNNQDVKATSVMTLYYR